MASIEREVENALLNVVSGVTGVNFFTSERGTARTMPSVTVQAQIGSEELVPFSGVFKTPTTITYVARADTTARADFDAKFYDILEQLYRDPDLASYLTTNSNITFYVAKVTGDTPTVISQNRTWSRAMTLDITATAAKIFSPLNISGLSLWLKADAGVSKLSYNYASQIIISGTSNPSFVGTYTAIGVPGYGNDRQEWVDSYMFSGPSGKTMQWNPSDEVYYLFENGSGDAGGFASGNGVNWSASNSYTQIFISGFTGIYSGANGTYNGDGNYFERVGGAFYINGINLYSIADNIIIATAPANYSGAWTPATYISRVTLSGATNASSINGSYDATENFVVNSWTHSNGGYIYFDGDFFVTNEDWSNSYSSSNLIEWAQSSGPSPAPTGILTNSPRSIGSAISTSSSVPSGSITGSVTTATANTNNVTSWSDQSGNGNNASVENSGEEPTFVSSFSNSKPSIQFNGTSQLLIIPDSSSLDFINTSIFIVLKRTGDGTGNEITFMKNANALEDSGAYWQTAKLGGGNSSFDIANGGYYDRNSGVDIDDGVARVMDFTFNGTDFNIYVNGIQTATYNDQVGNIDITSGSLQIGGYNKSFNNPGGELFNGQIAEIIMYNRAVTTQERQQVEAYLNTKYAIY